MSGSVSETHLESVPNLLTPDTLGPGFWARWFGLRQKGEVVHRSAPPEMARSATPEYVGTPLGLLKAIMPAVIIGLGAFLVALCLLIALNAAMLMANLKLGDYILEGAESGAVILFNLLLLGGCIVWSRKVSPHHWSYDLGFVRSPVNGRMSLIFLATILLSAAWINLIIQIVGSAYFDKAVSTATLGNGVFVRITTAYAMIIFAPVAEEIFFRGFLQSRLRRRFSFGFTLFVTTFAFSMVHYNGNIIHPLGVIVLSISCSLLRERTDSIWPPIFMHSINNTLVLVAMIAKA